MVKVTAFVGSARKKHTHDAVVQLLHALQALDDVECEMVSLSDYTLKPCRGCGQCVEKGEEFCPLSDDRDVLLDKIMASGGIVWATPNYCGQVSGIMKVFLDRFVFLCHRPRYFGKVSTSIVTQSINGGKNIVAYLDTLAMALGFTVAKGTCVTPQDLITAERQRKIDRALTDQARRFHAELARPGYPAPTWLKLLLFRVGRNAIRLGFDEGSRDFRYYTEQGWFTSEYYYHARLGPMKKVAGQLMDTLAPVLLARLA